MPLFADTASQPLTRSSSGSLGSSTSTFSSSSIPHPAPPPTTQLSPTPVNPTTLGRQYETIFGPPTPLNPGQVASQIQSLIGQAPKITAPVATPAQIQLPGGTYQALQQNLYNAQFGPVSQEINRQASQADTALSGQLAQAGLGDSGSAIGQREMQRENYDTYLQNVSQNIAASASSQALSAEIGVASANAQLQQQTSLANAGFNLAAQTENAKNALAGNEAAAQGYLAVLGINAQQAATYRSSFNQFLGIETQAAEAQDKFRLDAQGQMFNFYLQQRSLDTQDWQLQQQANQQAFRNALDTKALDAKIAEANKVINTGGLSSGGPASTGGLTRSPTQGGGGGGGRPNIPNPNGNPGTPDRPATGSNSFGGSSYSQASPMGQAALQGGWGYIDPNTGMVVTYGGSQDYPAAGAPYTGQDPNTPLGFGPMPGEPNIGLGQGQAPQYDPNMATMDPSLGF